LVWSCIVAGGSYVAEKTLGQMSCVLTERIFKVYTQFMLY
jgi:hypothetical protein